MDPDDYSYETARIQQVMYGIPIRDLKAWAAQRDTAKRRGIPFRFGLLQWRLWWKFETAARRPAGQRGRKRDDLMMCRIGDAGAYEWDNVYCGTHKQNQNEPSLREKRSVHMKAWHRTHTCHLTGKTGAAHPRSKPVAAGVVIYSGLAEAARAEGITTDQARYRIRRGVWRYLDAGETT